MMGMFVAVEEEAMCRGSRLQYKVHIFLELSRKITNVHAHTHLHTHTFHEINYSKQR